MTTNRKPREYKVAVAVDEFGTISVYSNLATADKWIRKDYPIVVEDSMSDNRSYYANEEDADNDEHGVRVSIHMVTK